jgi:hypothetical protein
MDRPLVFEDFAGHVGEAFAIDEQGLADLPLTLIEAEPLKCPPSRVVKRPPFSLIFRGPEQQVLPQRLYRFDLAEIGKFEIFLVPVGPDGQGFCYQALFN